MSTFSDIDGDGCGEIEARQKYERHAGDTPAPPRLRG